MPTSLTPRSNWLGRYLAVEREFDDVLVAVLRDAAEDLYFRMIALPDTGTISNMERYNRYRLASKEITSTLKSLFGTVQTQIKVGQKEAAAAAAKARIYEDNKFLETLFPDEARRASYAKSLEGTARRNIEAVMSRELETKMPLSQRVYKTRALSRGWVDREVNRALARGDGAKEIADAVKDMIRPDVRGGVSYAAMRLGRTEVHNAFHAQARHDIEESPFATRAVWNLSLVHEEIGCVCEEYADIKYFDKFDIPDPPHPQCRCYITAEQIGWDDFEKALLTGEFDNFEFPDG